MTTGPARRPTGGARPSGCVMNLGPRARSDPAESARAPPWPITSGLPGSRSVVHTSRHQEFACAGCPCPARDATHHPPRRSSAHKPTPTPLAVPRRPRREEDQQPHTPPRRRPRRAAARRLRLTARATLGGADVEPVSTSESWSSSPRPSTCDDPGLGPCGDPGAAAPRHRPPTLSGRSTTTSTTSPARADDGYAGPLVPWSPAR